MRIPRYFKYSYWKIVLNPNYWKTKNSMILVYNPSKVGSSSVYFSLKECFPWLPVTHVHYLNKDWLSFFEENSINNWKNNKLKAIETYKLLKDNKDRRIKIITLVRDPIALELSSVFQGWKELFNIQDPKDIKDQEILSYLNRKDFNWLQTWYSKELLSFTGIDVTKEPFEPRKGYGVYSHNGMDVLLIKLENLDRVKDDAMREFMGVNNIRWQTKNSSSEKGEIAERYARIQKSFGIDEKKLSQVYENDFMTKFYSREELDEFRKRWCLDKR